MPTQFLKDRHPKFFAEVAGRETIDYVPFVAGTPDTLTGEQIDEAACYATTAIGLPGLVQFSPSQSVRDRLGLEIDFEATIRVPAQAITDAAITLKIGDRFTLPDGRKYYIVKAIQNAQASTDFLEYLIAVSAKVGRRG